jgi:hypothetical protein
MRIGDSNICFHTCHNFIKISPSSFVSNLNAHLPEFRHTKTLNTRCRNRDRLLMHACPSDPKSVFHS